MMTLLLCLAQLGFGQSDFTEQAHSRVQLVAAESSLAPGATTYLGLHFQLDPDWHTYWVNPGDSASASIFDWQLPKDYEISGPLYPLPKRIKVGPLYSFGYENEVLLPFQLKVPREAKGSVSIQLAAEWLVCKVECLPAFYDFQIEMPIASSSSASSKAPLFEKALAAQPNSIDLSANISSGPQFFQLELHPPKEIEILDLIPFPRSPVSNQPPERLENNSFRLKREQRDDARPIPKVLAVIKSPDGGIQSAVVEPEPVSNDDSPLSMVFFAFLGGLLLNLMPCVFPILFLKFYSMTKSTGSLKAQLSYTMGILVSMWILSFSILGLKTIGYSVGWGFQLQQPVFLFLLILLFFLLSLNFLSLVEFESKLSSVGQSLFHQNNSQHYQFFLTGVLAVVVASPCTAPFMGASIGYAISRSAIEVFLIFSSLGIGLAFPYLLIGAFPALGNKLPKPGQWMETLKELMAFPLLATMIWLIFVLQQQTGSGGMALVLSNLLFVSFLIWLRKKGAPWPLVLLLFLSLSTASGYQLLQSTPKPNDSSRERDGFWEPFSEERLEKLISEKRPVFVNFTAAWCISCQVNERVTFSDEETKTFVAARNIKMLKADWTNRDESIARILKRYQRAGVPLYLYFSPESEKAVILPEILTPSIFMAELKKAR